MNEGGLGSFRFEHFTEKINTNEANAHRNERKSMKTLSDIIDAIDNGTFRVAPRLYSPASGQWNEPDVVATILAAEIEKLFGVQKTITVDCTDSNAIQNATSNYLMQMSEIERLITNLTIDDVKMLKHDPIPFKLKYGVRTRNQ